MENKKLLIIVMQVNLIIIIANIEKKQLSLLWNIQTVSQMKFNMFNNKNKLCIVKNEYYFKLINNFI